MSNNDLTTIYGFSPLEDAVVVWLFKIATSAIANKYFVSILLLACVLRCLSVRWKCTSLFILESH